MNLVIKSFEKALRVLQDLEITFESTLQSGDVVQQQKCGLNRSGLNW